MNKLNSFGKCGFSHFLLTWEEGASDLWEAFFKGKGETTDKHIGAHDSLVLSVENDATTVLVLVRSDELIIHDRKRAVVFVPASFLFHELMVLRFDVANHTFNITLVILAALNLQTWFNQLNHCLQNQILKRVQISRPVISPLVLQLIFHCQLDFVKAVVSFLHFEELGCQDLLRPLNIKLKLTLLYSLVLIRLMLLSSLENHLISLLLEVSLSNDFYLKCFFMSILPQHSLHLKRSLSQSNIGSLCFKVAFHFC